MRFFEGIELKRLSWSTLLLAGVLLAIGLAFVYSASYRSGPEGEGYYTSSWLKQLVWAVMGFCLMLAIIAIDYRKIIEWSYLIYGVCFILLLLTMVPGIGVVINNSRRWIDFGPLRLQTSELMKIGVILALARYLPSRENRRELAGLVVPFAMVLVPVVIVARQPDLGTSLMFLPVLLAMVYVAGARVKHLLIFFLMGLLALPCLWFVMKPYQRQHVISFIQQDTQDEELLMDELYHLTQSKAAIGSGGAFGMGYGRGSQNRLNFLPMRNTDFIFAVICEEMGFIRATGVLLLFLLFFLSCARVADRCKDPSGRLLVVGIIALFATQMLVNTGMSTGQLPTVGLPLPFMSYGGSALLMCFVGLGLVINVSMRPVILWGRERDDD